MTWSASLQGRRIERGQQTRVVAAFIYIAPDRVLLPRRYKPRPEKPPRGQNDPRPSRVRRSSVSVGLPTKISVVNRGSYRCIWRGDATSRLSHRCAEPFGSIGHSSPATEHPPPTTSVVGTPRECPCLSRRLACRRLNSLATRANPRESRFQSASAHIESPVRAPRPGIALVPTGSDPYSEGRAAVSGGLNGPVATRDAIRRPSTGLRATNDLVHTGRSPRLTPRPARRSRPFPRTSSRETELHCAKPQLTPTLSALLFAQHRFTSPIRPLNGHRSASRALCID